MRLIGQLFWGKARYAKKVYHVIFDIFILAYISLIPSQFSSFSLSINVVTLVFNLILSPDLNLIIFLMILDWVTFFLYIAMTLS